MPKTQKSSNILLTPHQKKIYEFVNDFVEKNHYSPSFREIQSHFSFSSLSSVHKHLHTLQRKGVLSYLKGERRSIALTPKTPPPQEVSSEYVLLPIIAELLMGQPLYLFSSIQAKLPISRKVLTSPEEAHILQVLGSHLLNFHICNRDFLIVEAKRDWHEKDLLLVQDKQGRCYIKQFYEERENSSFLDPLLLTREEIKYGTYSVMATLVLVIRNSMLS
jgi:repressor LexA